MRFERSQILRLFRNGRGRKYTGSWLFHDRENEAGDNAEYLYDYVMKYKKDIYFTLRRDSIDWNRLTKKGFRMIEWGSEEHLLCILHCKYQISSFFDYFHNNVLRFNRKLSYIFLQHGVIKDNMSRFFTRFTPSMFITSTDDEYKYIKDNFNLPANIVKLTGLARHDRLGSMKKSKDTIFLFPTWRRRLKDKDLTNEVYYIEWMKFIESGELKSFAEENGLKIVMKIHPSMVYGLNFEWKVPKYVEINNEDFGLTLSKSAILITDYSSIAFEAAYIYKPIIYYQFDAEYFRKTHLEKGYFEYERDGFGKVVNTVSRIIDEMKVIAGNNLEMSEEYREKANRTFKFRDGRCCERIYNLLN